MNITQILKEIEKIFPNPNTELYYETPFQLLIAVILSAQSTDKQVNKVTRDKKLFEKIKKPEDIQNMGYYRLRDSIKNIGLTNSKARNIYKLSYDIIEFKNPASKNEEKILKNYGYIIPDDLKRITKLSGVGEKTGKVVLSVLYNQSVVPVDTHVHRVVNRLGIVDTKNELQTSKKLEEIIPKNIKNKSHHLLIFFGRYFCTSQNPKCYKCPFKDVCLYYNNYLKK